MKRCILAALTVLLVGAGVRAADPVPTPAAFKKAQVDGKYAMLLRQIHVPDDLEGYGEFNDWGFWPGTAYAGHDDLPPGQWVYLNPYWYIWRDLAAAEKPMRSWGPEQAIGEPDTTPFGDIQTAWASRTADEADEWLMLEYAEPVRPNAVRIHETYNPGALTKVTAFKLNGEEVTVWQGRDPVNALGVAEIALEVDFLTSRVKLYLDSRNVSGWNEIDAVGLKDPDGKVQWARAAAASTTYAEQSPQAVPDQLEARIRELEAEVQRLKAENERLKKIREPAK